jgi:hypothetical protein
MLWLAVWAGTLAGEDHWVMLCSRKLVSSILHDLAGIAAQVDTGAVSAVCQRL